MDWTDGCIAVTNPEMDEIWRAVPDGTPIEIRPRVGPKEKDLGVPPFPGDAATGAESPNIARAPIVILGAQRFTALGTVSD